MATIQKRKSRGQTYWYIVESRRVNGKPRPITLAYLGKAEDLLLRLSEPQRAQTFKSYSHGDTCALLKAAEELDVVKIINQYIPVLEPSGKKPMRDGLTVGGSLLLAAIGRACQPTSKASWYDWCKGTSLEYCLKTSFTKLDSQHFWDQMNALPVEAIPHIEKALVQQLITRYQIKPDCLFFDTTNFFTFIDSENTRCELPKRGRNKQKRHDLRQIGLALLVTREEQLPLFHKTYEGNQADVRVFKNNVNDMLGRLRDVLTELSDITLVFDKGNNSKENFSLLDQEGCYYVGGLVSSYFKTLIEEANTHFTMLAIDDDKVPVYRVKTSVWGKERTCVVTVSRVLKEGQLRGIHQQLIKKYESLNELKQKLEKPTAKLHLTQSELTSRLNKIIQGQFIEEFLKYELIELGDDHWSFIYYIDYVSFRHLENHILGRKILVTNRDGWSNAEIILAYRGQAKVEYAFRSLKNPYHCAARPQFHWTDQKIQVHILTCLIGYLLAVCVYTKAKKAGYLHNLEHLLEELNGIRSTHCIENRVDGKRGKLRVSQTLEKIDPAIVPIAEALQITQQNLKSKVNVVVYK